MVNREPSDIPKARRRSCHASLVTWVMSHMCDEFWNRQQKVLFDIPKTRSSSLPLRTYVCMYLYLYAHTHTNTHTQTRTHTHTHTHTPAHKHIHASCTYPNAPAAYFAPFFEMSRTQDPPPQRKPLRGRRCRCTFLWNRDFSPFRDTRFVTEWRARGVTHEIVFHAYERAVCCSVLQCVAVCCNVLQCVAVCCSVLQCVAVCCRVLQGVAGCCRVLQGVAGCCSVLHGVTVWVQCECSVLPCVTVCCSVLQQSCHIYVWVMSHLWNRHVTHDAHYAYECVTSHMHESCHTYERDRSLILRSHVTHMKESCHTSKRIMPHVWMSHVTHMNESCHTYEWGMSHI